MLLWNIRKTILKYKNLFSLTSNIVSSCMRVFTVLHLPYNFKGTTWRFTHIWKVKRKCFKIVVCSPCQSSPSLTILVPLWFIIISLVFFYLSKLLFSGFLQFKGNSVRGQNTQDIVTELLWKAHLTNLIICYFVCALSYTQTMLSFFSR